MGRLTALALRSVIVALLVGSACLQGVMGVLLFREEGGAGGDTADFPLVPVALIIVLGVACAETVLVSVWRLLSMARGGTVFSRPAFRHVDRVTGAFAGAAVLLWAPGEAVAPGVVLLTGVAGLAVLGVALIVLVLRVLLAQAVARDIEASRMQAELAGVI
ncbi:DUF2975 domain-containing protein [Streptomyces sp. NPDC048213]|uniref:DUF2975 domain-containing protein n=1 Tax=Streptomyces TaxID=1883 RepID=UPI0033EF4A4B